MKYILILAVIFMVKPAFAQQSDWTDADRKRVTDVCAKAMLQEVKDLTKKNKINENDPFIRLGFKVMEYTGPMTCGCFAEKAETKYPKRNDFATQPEPELIKAMAMTDKDAPNAKLLEECANSSLMDSTKAMGWGVGLEEYVINAFFTKGHEGLNTDQIKAFNECAFAKFKAKYPNLIYGITGGKLMDVGVFLECTQTVKK